MTKINVTIIQKDYIFEKENIIREGLMDEHDCYNSIIGNLYDQYIHAFESKTKARKKLNHDLLNFYVRINKEVLPMSPSNLKTAFNITTEDLYIVKLNSPSVTKLGEIIYTIKH